MKKKITLGIILFISIYLVSSTIPYYPRESVSTEYQANIANTSFTSDSIGSERVAYIDDNVTALEFRLKMIECAKSDIILSTYCFKSDEAGKDIMASLYHAADNGVSVKIIIDGFSGLLDVGGDIYFETLTSHPNVSIKIYNPINLAIPWKIQGRLHDKYLIIDNSMYLLGGRNTSNLFLGDYDNKKNIDSEVFVFETTQSETSSIQQLKSYFNEVWESPDSKNFDYTKSSTRSEEKRLSIIEELMEHYVNLRPTLSHQMTYEEWMNISLPTNTIHLIYNPITSSSKAPNAWYALLEIMKQGDRITIQTPYLICNQSMYQDLKQLSQQSESVDIIINDITSGANPWGCVDYLNEKKNILKTGVTVYEYLDDFSKHTKSILVDNNLTIIGSFNFDMRSAYINTELMLVIDSIELNTMLQDKTAADKTYSKSITADSDYQIGENYVEKSLTFWQKIFYAILRIIILPFRYLL